jgi:hypothetical protein
VAAGTAVVTWGTDIICKKATAAFMGEEKSVTEFVSDLALDSLTAAGKSIVTSAKNTIAGWFRAPAFA